MKLWASTHTRTHAHMDISHLLSQLRLLWQNTTHAEIKQQTFTSQQSGGWKGWEQGAGWFSSWSEPFLAQHVLTQQRQDGLGSPPFLVRALILSWGSTFMTSANRNSFPKACLLIASHCGLGLQCKNSVGGHFHCITCLHTHTHTCTLTYVHSVSTHTHACTAFHVHTVPTYPDSHLHRNVHTCSHAYRLYVWSHLHLHAHLSHID